MKSSGFKIIVLCVLLGAFASGCVRLKDKNEKDQAPTVRAFEMQNKTIEEPMFLVNGALVRQAELAQVNENNLERPLGARDEYEFHFEHLNFKEGGVIFTMGQIVRIYVNDLDSRGGKIISFPENIVAPIMAEGASGGSLYLSVQHARGDLTLIMVGGQGGQGMKGATGKDGISKNGMVSRGSRTGIRIDCPIGFRGQSGSQGAKGGSSGTAKVIIKDDSNFDLHLNALGGRGGLGGDGGDGGRSGPHGDLCRDISNEPIGPVGPRGPQGETGLVQEICVTRATGKMQCLYK